MPFSEEGWPFFIIAPASQGPCLSDSLVLWALQGHRGEHRRARHPNPRDREIVQMGDGQTQRQNWTEGQTLEHNTQMKREALRLRYGEGIIETEAERLRC